MIDSQITSLIPHRPPFLWVDRILEATKDSIVAEKKIPENEQLRKQINIVERNIATH